MYPNDNFLFRPYANLDPTLNEATADVDISESDADSEPNVSDDVKLRNNVSRQRLSFVHQAGWRKRLLEKYGNYLCSLDAIYKTTK